MGRVRIPPWLIFTGILATAVVVVGGWYLLQPSGKAPNFSLIDLDGNTFQLIDFKGKVVIIDFMATWCGPCKISMPGLKAIYEELEGQIIMISIDVDPIHETEQILRDWMNGWKASWMHTRDMADPPVSQLYDVTGIPTYVIVDKKGYVRYRHVGLTPEEKLSNEIMALLKE